MNSVERVKAICAERKIPLSRMERDLGFSNGYIGQLKKGVFPDDRIIAISNYLSVSVEYLLTGDERSATVEPAAQDDPVMIELYSIIGKMSEAEKLHLLEKARQIIEI